MLKTYVAMPVLDLIGKHESGGDYNAVWGRIRQEDRPSQPLTHMTVAAVLAWQDSIDHKYMSEASGNYQILEDTLRGIVAQMAFDQRRLFDEGTQDEMACYLLDGRGFQRFLDGQIDTDDMMIGLAKEWASLPVPHAMQGQKRWLKAGQSYYAGDGLNKAHASVGEVEQALAIARERYRSGADPDLLDQDPSIKPGNPGPMAVAILIVGAVVAFALLKG